MSFANLGIMSEDMAESPTCLMDSQSMVQFMTDCSTVIETARVESGSTSSTMFETSGPVKNDPPIEEALRRPVGDIGSMPDKSSSRSGFWSVNAFSIEGTIELAVQSNKPLSSAGRCSGTLP